MNDVTIWMLVGFLLSAYSVIGNDSIQTLGTFIASNKKTKWYYLWAFTALILVLTISYSWYTNDGDISFGRLSRIPFVEVKWYLAFAPLALVVLTRFGIPVSTSLLVLSVFTSSLVFEKILLKSAMGYAISAVSAYTLWIIIHKWDNKNNPIKPEKEKYWRILQWGATGFLWFTWLSHDIANIAVFLPRQLDIGMLVFVLTVFVIGLGYIFYSQGGKIQNIVLEKTNTNYVRSATMIDFFYAIVLLVFKEWSNIPMSTTWVFVGLLSGRELAIAMITKDYRFKTVFPIVGKDMLRLFLGLAVSIIIALVIQNAGTIQSVLLKLLG